MKDTLMKKNNSWKLWAGGLMILFSIVFYGIHYLVFKDAHHIFIYLIGDIAFVFIEVLMVTMIIHHLLHQREKRTHLEKMNMVIETFFSEFGKDMLAYLSDFDGNLVKIREYVSGSQVDSDLNFKLAHKKLKNYKSDLEIDKIDLFLLSNFLSDKRMFLLNLLQNPTLLEHETFTQTLMTVFHLAEELSARDLNEISKQDLEHTKIDIERAYNNLIIQWLYYMNYICKNYPYLYSFAQRTNPFCKKASFFDTQYETALD